MPLPLLNPNPNPNPNPTTKQYAIVNIQLNIVTCRTYPEKFIRYNVIAPFKYFPLFRKSLAAFRRHL